jgi:D-tyrosyl-tRNA(Tyr) deacylase
VIALIQRVSRAEVQVAGVSAGAIGRGVLALIGVRSTDVEADAARLLQRVLDYRLFPDADGRMNLPLRGSGDGLLLVPQFTLAADTRKGNRAGFSGAAAPAQALVLFERLLELARQQHSPIASGHFGADMQVSLVNDGPVTFWLES